MTLNFTKVDKVRLSLEEYTLNTRLRWKKVSDFDEKQDKVVLQWATVLNAFMSH